MSDPAHDTKTTLQNEYDQYEAGLNDPEIVFAIQSGEIEGYFERMVALKYRLRQL